MTSLAALQRSFQRHVRTGDVEVAAHVVGTDRVPVATRLKIYADAYRIRLVEGLAASYPRLEQLLGDDAFAVLAGQYIDREPSRYKSIRWFGDTFAAMLESVEPEQPWFAELARWEWAVAAAFDAADAAPMRIEALAIIAPEHWPGLRFEFQPSLQTLNLGTNAVVLFKALGDDQPPPAPQRLEQGEEWVVWRRATMPQYRSLAPPEAAALDSVRGGGTFEEMCERLCDHLDPEQVPVTAAGFLKGWITEEMVIQVM